MQTSFFKSKDGRTFFAFTMVSGKFYSEKLYYYDSVTCQIERSGFMIDINFLVKNYDLEECSRDDYFETKEKILDLLIGGIVLTTESVVSNVIVEYQKYDF